MNQGIENQSSRRNMLVDSRLLSESVSSSLSAYQSKAEEEEDTPNFQAVDQDDQYKQL